MIQQNKNFSGHSSDPSYPTNRSYQSIPNSSLAHPIRSYIFLLTLHSLVPPFHNTHAFKVAFYNFLITLDI